MSRAQEYYLCPHGAGNSFNNYPTWQNLCRIIDGDCDAGLSLSPFVHTLSASHVRQLLISQQSFPTRRDAMSAACFLRGDRGCEK